MAKYYVMVRWPKDGQCSWEVKGATDAEDTDVCLCRLGTADDSRLEYGFDVATTFPKNIDLVCMNKTFPEFIYEILEVEVT